MAILKLGVDAGGPDRTVKLKITKDDDDPREVIVKHGEVSTEDEVDKGDKLTIEVVALYEAVYNKETMGTDIKEMEGKKEKEEREKKEKKAEEKEASAKAPKSEAGKEESGASVAAAHENYTTRHTTTRK